MSSQSYTQKSVAYMRKLCLEIADRSVGSEGNRQATSFFEHTLASLGWEITSQEFTAMDWIDGGASLRAGGQSFEVYVSPYSLGCEIEGILTGISSIQELEQTGIDGKIVLLYGEIAKEQIMPKNFVFYNPEEHQRMIALLEKGKPEALICATGRNASLAGGVYPFPLIEDGDVDIPSVYMTDKEGSRLLPYVGKTVVLKSLSQRVTGKGCNVIGVKGKQVHGRVVVSAHIDAKKGIPGAIDNATGVAVLLLLAEMLKDYSGNMLVEIVAFNGEDYYAVPGQMLYLARMQNCFDEIKLNINIDGAGYKGGKSAFSFYGLPNLLQENVVEGLSRFAGIEEGPQWYQGDHSMFIQKGIPAIAVSSKWFSDHIDEQTITHTEKDNISIVDFQKLVEIAQAITLIVKRLSNLE